MERQIVDPEACMNQGCRRMDTFLGNDQFLERNRIRNREVPQQFMMAPWLPKNILPPDANA
jgi:hypothetical protein